MRYWQSVRLARRCVMRNMIERVHRLVLVEQMPAPKQSAPRFYARFIADSCACIPGRGTLYAGQRLEAKIRSQTQNWKQHGQGLKANGTTEELSFRVDMLRSLRDAYQSKALA